MVAMLQAASPPSIKATPSTFASLPPPITITVPAIAAAIHPILTAVILSFSIAAAAMEIPTGIMEFITDDTEAPDSFMPMVLKVIVR